MDRRRAGVRKRQRANGRASEMGVTEGRTI